MAVTWRRLITDNDYTAGDVLSKLKTVDGAGSGLDADLLDGSHAAAFAASGHNHDSVYGRLAMANQWSALNKVNQEAAGWAVDAQSAPRLGLMKFADHGPMLLAGSTHPLVLAHRTDSADVSAASPTIRYDLYIDTAGRVGIGTSSVGAPLEVVGDVRAGNYYCRSDDSGIAFGGGSNYNKGGYVSLYGKDHAAAGQIDFVVGSTAPLRFLQYDFGTNWTERMRLHTDGNLGIGTALPLGRVHSWDGNGAFMHRTLTGIGASEVEVIPDGTGDVANAIRVVMAVKSSGGDKETHTQNMWTPATNYTDYALTLSELTLRLYATGRLTVRHAAGTAVYSVSLLAVWI